VHRTQCPDREIPTGVYDQVFPVLRDVVGRGAMRQFLKRDPRRPLFAYAESDG
jgi:hypothetical protein